MANQRRITTFAQAALYTAIFVAILAVINFLANRYNKTYDTTSTKRYTLSDQSAKIIRESKEDITITYWNRPADFRNAQDLFDRYKTLSPKINVEYKDVDKNRTEAIAAGVQAPGTIFVQVGNKKEQAKSLLEEEVTGAMVRALKGGDRTVCFTSGYGEGDIDDAANPSGYGAAKDQAERNNYKTQKIALIPDPKIPETCTILVVGGPKRDYLQPVVDAIKMYVEGGGRALIMLDPPLKFGSQVDDNAALVSLLATWGVKMNKDLVLDLSGIGQLFGMGPELPVVTDYKDHAIVREMKNMATAFPIARSIEATSGEKTTVTPLFATSDDSVVTTDMNSQQVRPAANSTASRVLGVAGEYNPGGDGTKGRFVVVGSSRWIGANILGFNGNRDLFLNILNWLSSDEDLISIRPKDPEDRRLNMNARQMTFLFWGSVVGMPVLFVLAGLGVWWRRR